MKKLELSSEQIKELNKYILSEKDFYPPEDTRYFKSGINNIPYGGDSFEEYSKWFYDNYSDDLFEY